MLCKVCLENDSEEIFVNGEKQVEFCSKICHYESLKVPLAAVWERDNGVCHLCGEYVYYEQASRDHLVPKFNGGPTTFDNVALAHKTCNSKRGVSPIEDFRRRHHVEVLVADGKL